MNVRINTMATTPTGLENIAPRENRSGQAVTRKSEGATTSPTAATTTSAGTPASLTIPTGTIFDAVGVVLDLSLEGRSLLGTYENMNNQDQGAFLDMLSSVLDSGIVGTETLEVNGQAYTTDAASRLGDPRLMHSPPYRGRTAGVPQVDWRA